MAWVAQSAEPAIRAAPNRVANFFIRERPPVCRSVRLVDIEGGYGLFGAQRQGASHSFKILPIYTLVLGEETLLATLCGTPAGPFFYKRCKRY